MHGKFETLGQAETFVSVSIKTLLSRTSTFRQITAPEFAKQEMIGSMIID